MSSEKDDLFGKLCVQQGYLTPDALAEARASQATAGEQLGMAMSLADVAVSKKLLTSEQREEVMRLLRVQTGEARTVGGYEVVAKIGEGGMGVVYKARTQGGETVALKVLPPSLARTPGLLKRFQREAEVARSLAHDNIVRFIEFGLDRDKKLYYCALEFVEGEDLSRKVSREGKVAEKDALEIARRIALALEHASARGLVHRDVKPQNVMLTPKGTAKLLDLGLARSVGEGDTRMTQEGMFVGSPHYASPEQARGERELDVRSDIYSLGATLYYMVTGETPFAGSTAAAVLTQVVSGSHPWPAEVDPDVSEGTCLLIEKMMARDPADRYARPAELARDIDILIAGGEAPVEPVERGMSAVERPGRGGRGPLGARQRRSTRGHAPIEREGSGGSTATYAAVGAGLALVALVVLFLVYGGRETEPPARVALAPRRVAPAKKKKPSPPGSARERQLEDMLAFAEKYHKDNPAEFERAVTNFQKARDAARGTRLELMADSRAQEIREEWKRAALEALGRAKAGAAELVEAGDIDGALAKLGTVPEKLASRVEGETRVASEKIKADGHGLLGKAMASALERLAAGDAQGARAALDGAGRVRFAEGRTKLAAMFDSLRTRIAKAEETRKLAAVGKAKEGLAGLLDEFEKLVESGDYAGARKRMLDAAADGAFAPIKDTLAAVARVAGELEKRREAALAGARALVGKKVALRTSKGLRKGEVEKVDERGIALATKVIINRQARGLTRFVVAWADLAPEEEDKLAKGWTPAGADGGIARAIVAIGHEDPAAAGKALASAGEHPLAERVRRKIDEIRLGEVEAAAAAAWRGIERRAAKRKPSAKEAKAILAAIDAFEKDYGKTRFARSVAAKLAQIKTRLSELAVVAIWRSYEVTTSDGFPQGVVTGKPNALQARLEFYESIRDGGVDQGHLFRVFNPGKHRDPACLVDGYWSHRIGAIPYVGKSTIGRGKGVGETGAPEPLGVRDIQVHPPWNRHTVVTAFVAPADGSYTVSGLAVRRILPGPPGRGTVRYKVFDAGKGPVAELIASRDRWTTDAGVYRLGDMVAGDRIYFAIDPDGPNHSDVTQIVWTVTLTKGASARASRTAGKAAGILTTKGPGWIEVKLDGERVARRYVPLDDARGRPDQTMFAKIRKLVPSNLVKLAWKLVGGRRRIVAVETVVPAEMSGTVAGTITAKAGAWIDVKPLGPGGGPTERYMARWMGGMPAAGGGPERPIVAAIARLAVGSRVKLDWMYDVRKRIVKLEPAGAVAAGPAIAPGVKFRDTFERGGTSGWFVARFSPAIVGKVKTVRKTGDPRGGKALALSTTFDAGKISVIMRNARDINRLTLSIRTMMQPTDLIIAVNEEDGSSYNSAHHLEPLDGWKQLDLDLALFKLGDDSRDENGALDFDQIRHVAMLDPGGILGQRGDKVILIDDIVGEYRPSAKPPPAGGEVF